MFKQKLRTVSTKNQILLLLYLALVLALNGCTASIPQPHDIRDIPRNILWPGRDQMSSTRENCAPVDTAAVKGGSFVFAVTDSVNPGHAPVPFNNAERIVFAHLYETLVNVNCQGQATSGLADKWVCTSDSTIWVFHIREDARFWDGSAVTSASVKEAWGHNQQAQKNSGFKLECSPWSWFTPQGSSVRILDAKRLAVQLPEAQAQFPLLMAHPATAISTRRAGWQWPVGSGPCRLRASTPTPLPELVCRPNQHHPLSPIWKQLTFLVKPGTDSRDLISSDSDLMVVRDLSSVRFFDDVPGYTTTKLPWDRLYLLACPPETNPRGSDRWFRAASRLEVPRDITRVDTRTWPEIVFPGGEFDDCPQLTGPITNSNSISADSDLADQPLDHNVLLYNTNDIGSRELAQRLSGLTGTDVRMIGVSETSLSLALQWQMTGAIVLAMDQHFASGCLQTAALIGKASWLQNAALQSVQPTVAENLADANRLNVSLSKTPNEALISEGIIYPLALTRSWLIMRQDLAGITLAFDGTPLLYGLGLKIEERGSS